MVTDDSIRETYMMCKEVRLINPDEPRKTSKALIFFDTGSDCNYVTESMETNDESYKFQTVVNITRKELQIHMDRTEQTWKLKAIGTKDLMTDYQEKNHRVKNQNVKHGEYLPALQAVISPEKSITKLRVVFDASAKTKKGSSLNECLYRGPVMMPSSIRILLRARQGCYLVVADVEKAFL
uniref:DUF1758 domain-containing protein n=1 Tax=Loa loa TaxID=7209 RepID=A0A1I7V8F8_LOALO